MLLLLRCVFIANILFFVDQEKVSDYAMKLVDLDTEHLGIPVSYQIVDDFMFIIFFSFQFNNYFNMLLETFVPFSAKITYFIEGKKCFI